MAVVKQSLQVLSGKVGNVVYRRRGKINYMAALPKRYKMSKSPEAQAARKRFKTLSAFSKYVNTFHRLKEIWNDSTLEGLYAYNKIMKANAPHMQVEDLSVYNMIAPKTSEDPIKSLTLSKTELFLSLNNYVFPPEAEDFFLTLILTFYSPVNPGIPFMEFAFVQGNAQPGTLDYKFQLSETAVRFIGEYQKVIAYTALSFTQSKHLSCYSNTAVLFQTSEIT
ncbi:MAG: hypothetical protein RBR95_11090 [Ignavibacteriaceae bacterium]|jgi:hypothetical protein|nr:hypothetical protein [Ignavibacteriaceae bacterium]